MSINSLNIETVIHSIICLYFGVHFITAILPEIANYPGVTTDDCGKGQIPVKVDDHYFEWNKFDDPASSLLNGRPALPNEVPFVVPIITWVDATKRNENKEIISRCIGTIINSNWVIASKVCLMTPDMVHIKTDTYEHLIYPGNKDFKGLENLHTTYNTTRYFEIIGDGNEMALLKYEKPITLANTTSVNSVCLPKNKNVNISGEFALITGFGSFEEIYTSTGKTSTDIYIGWAKFDDDEENSALIRGYQPIPFGGHKGCVGALGSPVVQYVNYRAVLIGIYLARYDFIRCFEHDRGFKVKYLNADGFHRISTLIDKIINTIKSN